MQTVIGFTMINFLHWLVSKHPEAQGLKDIPREDLLRLTNEFEHVSLYSDPFLEKNRNNSFQILSEEGRNRESAEAKDELEKEKAIQAFNSSPEEDQLAEPVSNLDLQIISRSNNNTLLHRDIASERTQDLDQYIGSMKSLKKGTVYQELTDQLIKHGVKPMASKKTPKEDIDILERYINVPLHAVFLYSSEDQDIASYISDNWGALDTLSSDLCDIHPSIDQFENVENGYIIIEKLDVIKKSGFKIPFSQLPAVLFWDKSGAMEYISFGPERSAATITHVIRKVFEEIYKAPTISSVTQAKELLRKEKQADMKEEPTKKRSRWSDLFVILLAFVCVIGGIIIASRFVPPLVLGIVLIAALLFLFLIIWFLMGPQELTQENFMNGIYRFFDALPLLRGGSNKQGRTKKKDETWFK